VKIISVVGARPNFMKIAPFIQAINEYNAKLIGNSINHLNHILIHTGQHYDDRMSNSFFESLNIPKPNYNLGVGSGSHAEQVGSTMIAIETVLLEEKPDWVVVVGDVNATLACTITAKKLLIKVCHIEAGLRSLDEKMPEEINRLVTDRLSDLLLTPDKLSIENLKKEGILDKKIKFVGNIMIDTLEKNYFKASSLDINKIIQENSVDNNIILQSITLPTISSKSKYINSDKYSYALLTLHRPSNVDNRNALEPIFNFINNEVTKDLLLIWPIHLRTQKMLKKFDLWNKAISNNRLILLHPIGYLEMLRLNMDSKIIFTDSGGLQEECCILGTPCLTLRWNTERPITLLEHGGLNILVGNDVDIIRREYRRALLLSRKPHRPKYWDGKAAERCLNEILKYE